MILRMFSIFDIKSDTFNTPFFMAAKGQAVRAFSDLVNDPNSQIALHPEDYKLYDLGEFNMVNAEFVPSGAVSLGFGSDYVNRKAVALKEVSNG